MKDINFSYEGGDIVAVVNSEQEAKKVLMGWLNERGYRNIEIFQSWGLTEEGWRFDLINPFGMFSVSPMTGEVKLEAAIQTSV